MEGTTPEDVQAQADKIVRLINGQVKRDLSTIYALVQIAARTLANTSGMDAETVVSQLSRIVRESLDSQKKTAPDREAVAKLRAWEETQLKHWYNQKELPSC